MDAVEIGERVRRLRRERGLSQAELGARAGLSRQAVGALEAGRHLPRVDAAVGLAVALGTTVEALTTTTTRGIVDVLGEGLREGQPVRAAPVGEVMVCIPVPGSHDGECWRSPDGVVRAGRLELVGGVAPGGLIAVGCDPALGIIADLAPPAGARILPVAGSSAAARGALVAGRAHAAVVHDVDPGGEEPGVEVERVTLARWRTGLAAPADAGPVLEDALAGRGPVVQREEGAGAQQAYVRALRGVGGTVPSGPRAVGHLDAARRARETGIAAVTIEPVARALGLDFRALETHTVEVWTAADAVDLPGARALGEVLASARFRTRIGRLAGYDPGPVV